MNARPALARPTLAWAAVCWAARRPHEILFLAALVGGSIWSFIL